MSIRSRYCSLVLASLITLLALSPAQARDLPSAVPEKVGLSSERLARLDRFVHAQVDAGRTPGAVTMIVRHGKVVHVDAYGVADVATGRRTAKDDLFRLYSMTKPITTVALLMLYEEGKFQLSDPLSKYFPEFADVRVYVGSTPQGVMLLDSPHRPISVEDIFRHTAGFMYGFGGGPVLDRAFAQANVLSTNLDEMIGKLAKLPLAYQPGDRWLYSVSHDVQAALVQKLSGMKFDEFVRQRIFTPLGMKDAMFKVPADLKSRVPALYGQGPDGKLVADTSPLGKNYGDQVFGGYSVTATAMDYALFAQMLLNKGALNGIRLLSPKTVELMTVNHLSETALKTVNSDGVTLGRGAGYGLGVSVLMDPAQHGNLGSAGEFGWSGAASTHFLVDPKEDMVAIYMTQLMGDYPLRSEIVTMVYQSLIGP
jgi:CubicO group peptidase (beta-lactamase class C family)